MINLTRENANLTVVHVYYCHQMTHIASAINKPQPLRSELCEHGWLKLKSASVPYDCPLLIIPFVFLGIL